MAAAPCRECGVMFDEALGNCPTCGTPRREIIDTGPSIHKKLSLVFLWIFALPLFVVVVLVMGTSPSIGLSALAGVCVFAGYAWSAHRPKYR